jgi:hypothetical protein
VTTVEPVRIRTDEFDRMTDVGLFDGRHVELLEGTLYEGPPMDTPHLVVLVRLQQMPAAFNAERRLLTTPESQLLERSSTALDWGCCRISARK